MQPRLSIRLALAASVAPLFALSAAAQETAPIVLDTIVLTAGFSPVEADAYGRAATVVTAEEIEKRGATTVQDALRGLPGVSFSGSGNSLGEVRLRGGEWRHTQVLIDGVSASGGEQAYNFGGLDIADVDRIEVLRGPQSVFYGSSAASGVINIITRKANATGGYARAEVGNGAAGAIGHAVVTDRYRLQFDGAYREDDGYDVSYGDGGDDDGLRRGTLSFSGEWNATEDLTFGFSTRHSAERVWFDGTNYMASSVDTYLVDAPYWADRDERINTLWAEAGTLDGRLTHRLAWEDSRVDLDSHDSYPYQTEARRKALKYRVTYGLDGAVAEADQTLALALDRIEDSSTGGTVFDRESKSVALEYRGAYDNGLDVQLGVRHDDNSDFADKTSWAAGLSWRVDDSWRVHASAGTGILNPLIYQLVGGYGDTGNPNLTQEENRSIDVGVEYTLPDGRGLIDVTWFHERLEDAIAYVPQMQPELPDYVNIDGTSRREGIEVAARYAVTDALTLGVAYTYLDAKNPDGSVATRRPRHELGLNATLQTFGGKGWVSADVRHVAGVYDTEWWHGWGNEFDSKLPDFTVVNVAASYDLNDSARISGRVNNLFDEEYSETWGYGTQGRTAWIGIEQRW